SSDRRQAVHDEVEVAAAPEQGLTGGAGCVRAAYGEDTHQQGYNEVDAKGMSQGEEVRIISGSVADSDGATFTAVTGSDRADEHSPNLIPSVYSHERRGSRERFGASKSEAGLPEVAGGPTAEGKPRAQAEAHARLPVLPAEPSARASTVTEGAVQGLGREQPGVTAAAWTR
ncbi:unnamed protein product, partial [Chrysoparadoxa australica]